MKLKLIENIRAKAKIYLNLLIVLVAVFFVLSLSRNIVKIFEVKKRTEKARQAVAKLESQNTELQKKLEEVKSQDYIEKQLRDKLGLAKEGETVIVLPDEETLKKIAPKPVEEQDVLPDPTWKKWIQLFF
jgi:cell division protein FtsB